MSVSTGGSPRTLAGWRVTIEVDGDAVADRIELWW